MTDASTLAQSGSAMEDVQRQQTPPPPLTAPAAAVAAAFPIVAPPRSRGSALVNIALQQSAMAVHQEAAQPSPPPASTTAAAAGASAAAPLSLADASAASSAVSPDAVSAAAAAAFAAAVSGGDDGDDAGDDEEAEAEEEEEDDSASADDDAPMQQLSPHPGVAMSPAHGLPPAPLPVTGAYGLHSNLDAARFAQQQQQHYQLQQQQQHDQMQQMHHQQLMQQQHQHQMRSEQLMLAHAQSQAAQHARLYAHPSVAQSSMAYEHAAAAYSQHAVPALVPQYAYAGFPQPPPPLPSTFIAAAIAPMPRPRTPPPQPRNWTKVDRTAPQAAAAHRPLSALQRLSLRPEKQEHKQQFRPRSMHSDSGESDRAEADDGNDSDSPSSGATSDDSNELLLPAAAAAVSARKAAAAASSSRASSKKPAGVYASPGGHFVSPRMLPSINAARARLLKNVIVPGEKPNQWPWARLPKTEDGRFAMCPFGRCGTVKSQAEHHSMVTHISKHIMGCVDDEGRIVDGWAQQRQEDMAAAAWSDAPSEHTKRENKRKRTVASARAAANRVASVLDSPNVSQKVEQAARRLQETMKQQPPVPVPRARPVQPHARYAAAVAAAAAMPPRLSPTALLKFTPASLRVVQSEEGADTAICCVCCSGDSTDENLLLLCDGPCCLAYHQDCLLTPPTLIPLGDWHCSKECKAWHKRPKPEPVVAEAVVTAVAMDCDDERKEADSAQDTPPAAAAASSAAVLSAVVLSHQLNDAELAAHIESMRAQRAVKLTSMQAVRVAQLGSKGQKRPNMGSRAVASSSAEAALHKAESSEELFSSLEAFFDHSRLLTSEHFLHAGSCIDFLPREPRVEGEEDEVSAELWLAQRQLMAQTADNNECKGKLITAATDVQAFDKDAHIERVKREVEDEKTLAEYRAKCPSHYPPAHEFEQEQAARTIHAAATRASKCISTSHAADLAGLAPLSRVDQRRMSKARMSDRPRLEARIRAEMAARGSQHSSSVEDDSESDESVAPIVRRKSNLVRSAPSSPHRSFGGKAPRSNSAVAPPPNNIIVLPRPKSGVWSARFQLEQVRTCVESMVSLVEQLHRSTTFTKGLHERIEQLRERKLKRQADVENLAFQRQCVLPAKSVLNAIIAQVEINASAEAEVAASSDATAAVPMETDDPPEAAAAAAASVESNAQASVPAASGDSAASDSAAAASSSQPLRSPPTAVPSDSLYTEAALCCAPHKGRPSVGVHTPYLRCDGCAQWFHVRCLGIHNEAELYHLYRIYCKPCITEHGLVNSNIAHGGRRKKSAKQNEGSQIPSWSTLPPKHDAAAVGMHINSSEEADALEKAEEDEERQLKFLMLCERDQTTTLIDRDGHEIFHPQQQGPKPSRSKAPLPLDEDEIEVMNDHTPYEWFTIKLHRLRSQRLKLTKTGTTRRSKDAKLEANKPIITEDTFFHQTASGTKQFERAKFFHSIPTRIHRKIAARQEFFPAEPYSARPARPIVIATCPDCGLECKGRGNLTRHVRELHTMYDEAGEPYHVKEVIDLKSAPKWRHLKKQHTKPQRKQKQKQEEAAESEPDNSEAEQESQSSVEGGDETASESEAALPSTKKRQRSVSPPGSAAASVGSDVEESAAGDAVSDATSQSSGRIKVTKTKSRSGRNVQRFDIERLHHPKRKKQRTHAAAHEEVVDSDSGEDVPDTRLAPADLEKLRKRQEAKRLLRLQRKQQAAADGDAEMDEAFIPTSGVDKPLVEIRARLPPLPELGASAFARVVVQRAHATSRRLKFRLRIQTASLTPAIRSAIRESASARSHPSAQLSSSSSDEASGHEHASDSDDDPDAKACMKCGGTGNPNRMLLCDTCDGEMHMDCCEPPLKVVPTKRFDCTDCKILLKRMKAEKRGRAASDGVRVGASAARSSPESKEAEEVAGDLSASPLAAAAAAVPSAAASSSSTAAAAVSASAPSSNRRNRRSNQRTRVAVQTESHAEIDESPPAAAVATVSPTAAVDAPSPAAAVAVASNLAVALSPADAVADTDTAAMDAASDLGAPTHAAAAVGSDSPAVAPAVASSVASGRRGKRSATAAVLLATEGVGGAAHAASRKSKKRASAAADAMDSQPSAVVTPSPAAAITAVHSDLVAATSAAAAVASSAVVATVDSDLDAPASPAAATATSDAVVVSVASDRERRSTTPAALATDRVGEAAASKKGKKRAPVAAAATDSQPASSSVPSAMVLDAHTPAAAAVAATVADASAIAPATAAAASSVASGRESRSSAAAAAATLATDGVGEPAERKSKNKSAAAAATDSQPASSSVPWAIAVDAHTPAAPAAAAIITTVDSDLSVSTSAAAVPSPTAAAVSAGSKKKKSTPSKKRPTKATAASASPSVPASPSPPPAPLAAAPPTAAASPPTAVAPPVAAAPPSVMRQPARKASNAANHKMLMARMEASPQMRSAMASKHAEGQ